MLADGLLRSEANQKQQFVWMQNHHSGNRHNLSVTNFAHVAAMWRIVYGSDQ
jgi:hypothetical protein